MDLDKSSDICIAELHFRDYWEIHKYKECIDHLKLMTEEAKADTSLLWGMCYRDGLGVRKDRAKAKQYFESVRVGSTVYFGINSETHYLLKCQVFKIKDGKALLQTEQFYNFPGGYRKVITPNGARLLTNPQ